MPDDFSVTVASDLRGALGPLMRRLRQSRPAGGPTEVEMGVLSRLDRQGAATAAELARGERITPQSAGATVGGLEQRGLVVRVRDPDDARRRVLDLTDEGRTMLAERAASRSRQLATSLEAEFDEDELARLAAAVPLLHRLAGVL